jgi:hypothetical protein
MLHLQLDRAVAGDVVLGLVTAAVAAHDERRGAFLERLAERVFSRNGERHSVDDARAAATPRFLFRRFTLLDHTFPREEKNSIAPRQECAALVGARMRNG